MVLLSCLMRNRETFIGLDMSSRSCLLTSFCFDFSGCYISIFIPMLVPSLLKDVVTALDITDSHSIARQGEGEGMILALC